MAKPEQIPCTTCGGRGRVQAPATATTYDKNGKPIKKATTHSMDCRACGGKGWRAP